MADFKRDYFEYTEQKYPFMNSLSPRSPLSPGLPMHSTGTFSDTYTEVERSREPSPAPAPQPKQNIKWIDGLRGIAAVHVVMHHVVTAWFKWLFWPCLEGKPAHILQMPIVRVLWHGKIAVPVFAFLTGYVCALKPIKLMNQGKTAECLEALRSSTFRRFPRLMLSPICVLLAAWVVVQLGGEVAATRTMSVNMDVVTPHRFPTIGENLYQLWDALWAPWTYKRMYYDDYEWAIFPLLMMGIYTYIAMLFVMNMKFRFRIAFYAIILWRTYRNSSDDTIFLNQTFHGIMLCDLSQNTSVTTFLARRRWTTNLLPLILFPIGLFFISYPYEGRDFTHWSRFLARVAYYITPSGGPAPDRLAVLGTDLCLYAIWLSPKLQGVLSLRIPQFLGRISYAIYLVHGNTMRTVFVWVAVSFTGQPWDTSLTNERGEPVSPPRIPVRGSFWVALAVVVYAASVIGIAKFWTEQVESRCEKFTLWLERAISNSPEDYYQNLSDNSRGGALSEKERLLRM